MKRVGIYSFCGAMFRSNSHHFLECYYLTGLFGDVASFLNDISTLKRSKIHGGYDELENIGTAIIERGGSHGSLAWTDILGLMNLHFQPNHNGRGNVILNKAKDGVLLSLSTTYLEKAQDIHLFFRKHRFLPLLWPG